MRMEVPEEVHNRKVLYKGDKYRTTSPKVSLPKWWVKDVDVVRVEVYKDKIIIRKKRV